MRRLALALSALLSVFAVAGCELPFGGGDGPATHATTVTVNADGPMVQVLPGPAVFADSAAPTIELFPKSLRGRFETVADRGPFSNNTARISGRISIVMRDAGPSGDSISGRAEFRTRDGAKWRLLFDRVNPESRPPFAARHGGVVTDFRFHGPTARSTPLMVLVESGASMWGFARVFRNGELLERRVPVHFMLTTRARRGPAADFRYISYTGSPSNRMTEVHLISRVPPSQGPLYESLPGGFLHVVGQEATFDRERTHPE